ncbi:MAG: hypothetical protein K2I57_08060 [Muribaculaceae bacterium]|nr:hypothetical protein [Muribaculaceae bacterium]
MITTPLTPVSIEEMKREGTRDSKYLIKCQITAPCPVLPESGIMPSCGSSLEDGCSYIKNPDDQIVGVFCKDENGESFTGLCPGFSSGGGSGSGGSGGSGVSITTDSNAQEQL